MSHSSSNCSNRVILKEIEKLAKYLGITRDDYGNSENCANQCVGIDSMFTKKTWRTWKLDEDSCPSRQQQ